MPDPVRRGKLAYQFFTWFFLISLASIGVVAYNLISISRDTLKKQSLRNQESAAVGFANMVWNYVTTYKNILMTAARERDFASGGPTQAEVLEREEQYLSRIMQAHAAFLELSIFDIDGQENLRKGRFLGPTPPMRNFLNEPAFQVALQRGEYVGTLERFQGLYPTLTLAVPIVDGRVQPPKPVGVLMGKISLNGLSTMLNQEFPEARPREAAVISPDGSIEGFLIAHSNPKFIFKPDPKLPKEVTDVILTQTPKKGDGVIHLPDGHRLLGAYAEVRELGWVVYVQEPLESAYEAVPDMMTKTFWVLVYIILIVALLSYAMARHITLPIRMLRQAADRLGRGQFEEPPEIVMTNDEIGDLAQTFLQMSESLREKTGELVHAKEELEKFTKFLERRVEARTRELKAAQDELINKERLAAIGQMASVVGHEIRNPLAVINNSAYFIKTKLTAEGVVDPKISKHIGIIESEIKQANGIINEILTFSRTRDLKPAVTSLNAFLEEILSVHPFPSQIQLLKEFDLHSPLVYIDPDEMRQAIRNLVGNAAEVMPQGGTLRVATQVLEERWVRLDIQDSGPGIPPEILEKIFNPFFTTKARGTGLGLAVVRKVVDRHQGKVEVESEVGRGTVFRIYIPLASKESIPVAPQAHAAAGRPVEPPVHPERPKPV